MAQDNSFEWGILMTSSAFHRAINTHGDAAALSKRGGETVRAQKGEMAATDKKWDLIFFAKGAMLTNIIKEEK